MKVLQRILLAVVLVPSLALAADTFECKAKADKTCTATIITQNGMRVPIVARKGEKLIRGEGQSVLLGSENWNKIG